MANAEADGRAFIRQAFLYRGDPGSSVSVSINAISASTIKQYASTYRLWRKFCEENSIQYFSASPQQVLSFFQELFDSSPAKFGTFNSHRSALSLILKTNIAQAESIKRFLKGIARLRPSRPRYQVTWDPSIVITYLRTHMAKSEDLSFSDLSAKLATLLALTSAHRIHTLSLIKVGNIQFTSQGCTVKIADITKTSLRTGSYPVMEFKFFTDLPGLCVATVLQHFLKVAAPRREAEDSLFISPKKPHRRATSATIRRWVKMILERAGLDISIFTAHSVRHAATSAAHRAGISVGDIRKAAG